MEPGKEGRRLEQMPAYKWMARGGTLVIMLLCLFMVKAGLDGRFHSIETLQQYIQGFGMFAPMILILIQAFQVVVPVLPGFFGCIVGAILFGAVGGFWCNYIGICAGSIIAFALARYYGAPLIRQLFPAKQYETWIKRLQNKRGYTCFFFLCILLPLAPDDFLCYFSGLIKMPVKKYVLIILSAKPWCLLFYSLGTGFLIN